MADINQDGKLSQEEFTLALYFIEMAKDSIPLPKSLPQELIPFSVREEISAKIGQDPLAILDPFGKERTIRKNDRSLPVLKTPCEIDANKISYSSLNNASIEEYDKRDERTNLSSPQSNSSESVRTFAGSLHESRSEKSNSKRMSGNIAKFSLDYENEPLTEEMDSTAEPSTLEQRKSKNYEYGEIILEKRRGEIEKQWKLDAEARVKATDEAVERERKRIIAAEKQRFFLIFHHNYLHLSLMFGH